MKVTDACANQGDETLFVCDFSPLKSSAPDKPLQDAGQLGADYICVAYNPGKAVRVNSAVLAYTIKEGTGTDVIFNLSPRDMNKLALQSLLLGADMLGLDNVLVIQGDPLADKDLSRMSDVSDYKATELIAAVNEVNEARDFKGLKLQTPTDLCVGASIDLGRGMEKEAQLTFRKALAGTQFFLAQPVWDMADLAQFHETYHSIAGEPLTQPIFWGLQLLIEDGIIFSSVPEGVREDVKNGRSGIDIAREMLEKLQEAGINRVYLIPPILRGGRRDYVTAQTFLQTVR